MYFLFSPCHQGRTTETDKWRARSRGGTQTNRWGAKNSSQLLSQFPETSQHSAASVLPRWVQFTPVSWCWCFRIDLSHSAVRHPALTMKQACGPNTVPSCFWLLSASVRTSGHMTQPVTDEAGRTPGVTTPPHTPSTTSISVPPPLGHPKILAPWGPQFSLTHTNTW